MLRIIQAWIDAKTFLLTYIFGILIHNFHPISKFHGFILENILYLMSILALEQNGKGENVNNEKRIMEVV